MKVTPQVRADQGQGDAGVRRAAGGQLRHRARLQLGQGRRLRRAASASATSPSRSRTSTRLLPALTAAGGRGRPRAVPARGHRARARLRRRPGRQLDRADPALRLTRGARRGPVCRRRMGRRAFAGRAPHSSGRLGRRAARGLPCAGRRAGHGRAQRVHDRRLLVARDDAHLHERVERRREQRRWVGRPRAGRGLHAGRRLRTR